MSLHLRAIFIIISVTLVTLFMIWCIHAMHDYDNRQTGSMDAATQQRQLEMKALGTPKKDAIKPNGTLKQNAMKDAVKSIGTHKNDKIFATLKNNKMNPFGTLKKDALKIGTRKNDKFIAPPKTDKPTAESLDHVLDKLRKVNTSGQLASTSEYKKYKDQNLITFENGQWKLTDKGMKAETNPTAERLDHVLDKLREVNASGQLASTSEYKRYKDQGLITFKDGQWKLTDKGMKAETNPTAERLDHVLDKLREVNTSGQLAPTSEYKRYKDQGLITFKDGQWKLTDKGMKAETIPTAERLDHVLDTLREVNTSGQLESTSDYKKYKDQKWIAFENGEWKLTEKGMQAETNPTAERLDQVLAKLQEVNTSGQLESTSDYKKYKDQKLITFENGEWKLTDKGMQAASGGSLALGGRSPSSGGWNGRSPSSGGLSGSSRGSVDSVNILGNGTVISANQDQSKFCSDVFGGGGHYTNVQKCGSSNLGGMSYVEGTTTGSSDMFNAAPDSAVKAAYFNMGTNNDIMKANSSGNISTTNQSGCLYGSEGGCIQWGDPSARAAAVASAKQAIKQAVDSGANTLRFDQLDVCEDNNGNTYSDQCSQGLRTALTEISQAAKEAGLGVVGNNGWKAQQALIDAQNSGGAKVVGAMLDDSFGNMSENEKRMRGIVGSDVPIFTAGY